MKYAYPGGKGAIEISAHEIEGQLHVEVSDEGVGLPEGFEIDQPRTSLGFKVIMGLVRQLQGHIAVIKGATKGARFLIKLPILPKKVV